MKIEEMMGLIKDTFSNEINAFNENDDTRLRQNYIGEGKFFTGEGGDMQLSGTTVSIEDGKEIGLYLVSVQLGHPTICCNPGSDHHYMVVASKEPISFYYLNDDGNIEEIVREVGDTTPITIPKGKPFTYKGAGLLAFVMDPPFKDGVDKTMPIDWKYIDDCPDRELFVEVKKEACPDFIGR